MFLLPCWPYYSEKPIKIHLWPASSEVQISFPLVLIPLPPLPLSFYIDALRYAPMIKCSLTVLYIYQLEISLWCVASYSYITIFFFLFPIFVVFCRLLMRTSGIDMIRRRIPIIGGQLKISKKFSFPRSHPPWIIFEQFLKKMTL